MAKEKKQRYILELDMATEAFHEHILHKRLEIGRKISNQVKSVLMKNVRTMKKDANYLFWVAQEKSETKNGHLQAIRESYDVSKTGAERIVKEMGKHFFAKNSSSKQLDKKKKAPKQKVHLDSHTVQKIAEDVWQSVSTYLFGDGYSVHFKKYGEMNSLESKTNKSGIRYVNGNCLFNGLVIPVKTDKNDRYAEDALHDEIAFCRIVRKLVRGKAKFYLQLVLKGVPPIKKDKEGNPKHVRKTGKVGLDIGISTLASVSDEAVSLVEFCEDLKPMQTEKRRLQRKLDRSRRSMNPNNYKENGTAKKGRRKWVKSRQYTRTLLLLKEMDRKIAAKRKIAHHQLANLILSMGDDIYCEKMNYKGLKKTVFGKRIALKAPSMFLTILNQKLSYQTKEIQYVNTWTVKASQYDPYSDTYTKKRLSDRFHRTGCGKTIQRDCFSAWLIQNVDEKLNQVNRMQCLDSFGRFYTNYELTKAMLISHARNKPTLSSIGL